MAQSDEHKPFLAGSDGVDEPREASQPRYQRGTLNYTLKASLAVNIVLMIICMGLSGSVFLSLQARTRASSAWEGNVVDPYSPANGVIEYEYRTMVGNDTRFTGHPSQVWEDSMHGLMKGTLFRVSQEELDLHGSDSIALKDGGFAAGLGVAHNLHCVKKIKQFLYREHFFPELDPTGGEFEYLQAHADHCLDFLRQSILCNLDYSMYTVYWGERRQDIPTHQMPGKQKCVNWDKLHSWMLGRAASVDDLVRPQSDA